MRKACIRLLVSGIVIFIVGIIGLAALELNGYDVDRLTLPADMQTLTETVGETTLTEEYNGTIVSYDSDEIDKLDINVKAGNFSIIGGDRFYIEATGINSECLKYEVNNKCLSVTYSPEFYIFKWDFFSDDEANIVITVPPKMFESADFSVKAGQLYVYDMETDKISIDFTAGNAYFVNVSSASSSQIKMTAGDCTFDNCIFNNANIKMTAGSMYYNACRIKGDNKITMTAGDLVMEIIGRRSDYDIDISRTAGDVYIDGIDMGRDNVAFTTFETTVVMKETVTGAVGLEYSETEISQVYETEKNTIDINITAGECNLIFDENEY